MIRKIVLLMLVFSISACVSVTDTVATVDQQLIKNADKATLEASSFKFNPARFHQSFLGYEISNARQSALSRSEAGLVANHKTMVTVDSNIIDWLVFGRPYPHDYSYEINNHVYEVETQSHFSFDFSRPSTQTIHTRCGSFYLEHSGRTYYDGDQNDSDINPAYSANALEQRVNTFLSCKYTQDKNEWYFSMELPVGGKPRTDFTGALEHWSIVPVEGFEQRLSDGTRVSSRELPFWRGQIAGFNIYYQDNIVGAISTIGKPHIWVGKSITQEQRDLAVSLLFSLAVFNDMDNDWSAIPRS